MSVTIRQFRSIRAAKKAWLSLEHLQQGSLSPYVRYNFQKLYYKTEWLRLKMKREHIRIFLLEEHGKPICLLPLRYRKTGKTKKWAFLADRTIVGALDALYAPDATRAQIEICLRAFFTKHTGECFVFNKLTTESKLFSFLGATAQNEPIVCVNVAFPDGYEPHYQSLRKSARQNIRTAYNRMATDGKSFTFECIMGKRPGYELIDELQRVHILRCNEQGYGESCEITPSIMRKKKFLKRFCVVEQGTQKLDNNCIAVFRIDGEVAAYMTGFTNDTTMVVPRLAIDTSLGKYSPGMLLLNEAMKYFTEHTSLRNIDLSTGDEQYKLTIGGQRYDLNKLSFEAR